MQGNLGGKRSGMATHSTTASIMKKSLSRSSESSMQFESPMRWDGAEPPDQSPEYKSVENSPGMFVDNSMAVVAVGKLKQFSPDKRTTQQKPPENTSAAVTVFNNKPTTEEHPRPVMKVSGGSERRSRSTTAEEVVRKAALGFRLSEVVVCLISFSVMAADKTQGWSGDSYDRYKEYRYCLCVNVIAFAYSGLQACDLAFQLVTGKHIIGHHLRYHFDFFMDQATSSAATRVDDWQSNWGKDEFTEMATVSVGMAFLAFVAFAMSSLISGYTLCTRTSM
ncbi:Casparian strip membrane protein domain [Sesbania bispinosa]|nr:Casparian strip membrane protein domain [Sesbania bispinosa]